MSKAERRKAKRRAERAGDTDGDDDAHGEYAHDCGGLAGAGRGEAAREGERVDARDGGRGPRGPGGEVDLPVEVDLAELHLGNGADGMERAEDVESEDEVAGLMHDFTHANTHLHARTPTRTYLRTKARCWSSHGVC